MCMLPERYPDNLAAVNSLIGQVDTLYLCLNNFLQVPPELQRNQIKILYLGENLGDVAKFYLLRTQGHMDAHVLSCDDDIIYPQSYVRDFLNARATYPDTLLTHHGFTTGHYSGEEMHFARSINQARPYFQPGSGVSFIPKSIFNRMEFSHTVHLNHADVHLACICQQLEVSIVGLPHGRDYLQRIPTAWPTLWGTFRRLPESDKQAIINEIRLSYSLQPA